ncbi:PKD domain-containing protein [Winogradskyella sp. DF17]|uniref:PKD domain-containing protein n=1 Tax=Winogradskyella pelagia TaxID=2819984 RepID=A0ABS3T5X6_9FLAO|nr:PKD domain-containing protein [Winogradskyella sp. DF17]MBO3117115.1 PKD domain-containing protein [Winogradskyella sp. DF17]
MIFLKNRINILGVFLMTLVIISCEPKEVVVQSNLEARFVSTVTGSTIEFINVSNDAQSYLWDFDNGLTTTISDPTQQFDNGTYTVRLTAFDKNGNSAIFEQTYVIDCEIDENIDPANGNLNWTFKTSNANTLFDAFGNTGGGIVQNPLEDAVNSSCNVHSFEKIPGCFTFAGLGKELNTALDFNNPDASKIFTMKVLAETQVTEVTLRLEFMPFPDVNPAFDRVATITEVGEWQELTFDFTGVTGTFKSMIIYFERNAPCDGDVYYFDDIIQQ